ncbi:hypothetical protein [Methylomonas sp. MK1]|uniref:hypothetical protein n=1 Tax=Methylomonas sp. MK1 TaxID=1131552 RepID=UPI00126830F8|nr:hypothetical protein [Methylomonas sp. MK1]
MEQIAKVSLAAPSIAWLPPFWVFPLNLLPRLDENWKNTVDYKIDVDQQTLNRFNSIYLLPGLHHASAQYAVSYAELIGSKTCTSSDSKFVNEDRSESCTRTTTCKGLFKFTEREHKCSLAFSALAGNRYELAVTNPAEGEIRLSLRDSNALQSDQWNSCHWTPDRSHDEYRTDTVTSDCSIKTGGPKPSVPGTHVERDDKRHVHEGRDRGPDSHPHPRPHIEHPHSLLELPSIPHKHEDRPFRPHDQRDTATDKSDGLGNHPRKPGKHKHPGETDIDKQEGASPNSFEVNIHQDTVPDSENGRRPNKDRSKMSDSNTQSQTLNSEAVSKQDQNGGTRDGATDKPESIPPASESSSKTPKTETGTEKLPGSGIDPNANSASSPSSESIPEPAPYSPEASDAKISRGGASNKDNTSPSTDTTPVDKNRQFVPSASVQSDPSNENKAAAPAPSHGNSDSSNSISPSVTTAVEPPISAPRPVSSPDRSPSTSSTPTIDSLPSTDSSSSSTSTSFSGSSAHSNTSSGPISEPAPASTPNPSYSSVPVSSPSANDSPSLGNTSSSSASGPAPISISNSSFSAASSSSASSSSNDVSTSSSPSPTVAPAPAPVTAPSPTPIPEPPVAPTIVAPATSP